MKKQAMQSRMDATLHGVSSHQQNVSKRPMSREEMGRHGGHKSPSPVPLGSRLQRIQPFPSTPTGQSRNQKRPKFPHYLLLHSHETTSAGTESDRTHESQKLLPEEESELTRWEIDERNK